MTFLSQPPERGLIVEALSETGQLIVTTFTDDLGGAGSVTETTGGTIRLRIDPLGGGEGEVAERLDDRSTHLVTLPPATDVTVASSLRIDGLGEYEITAVREHTDEFSRVIEVTPRS